MRATVAVKSCTPTMLNVTVNAKLTITQMGLCVIAVAARQCMSKVQDVAWAVVYAVRTLCLAWCQYEPKATAGSAHAVKRVELA